MAAILSGVDQLKCKFRVPRNLLYEDQESNMKHETSIDKTKFDLDNGMPLWCNG